MVMQQPGMVMQQPGMVMQQPGMVQQPVGGVITSQPGGNPSEWTDDLFGCCNDPGICVYTWCCPYCAFGSVMQAGLDKSMCTECCIIWAIDAVTGLGCIYHMIERGAFRQRYGLPEKPCCDCCIACICGPCSTCQMGRHTKALSPNKTNCLGM
jgi:Cys-rich protein (TIGR01571 family)